MGRLGIGNRGGRSRGALVLVGLAAFGLAACGREDAPTEPVGGSAVSTDLVADADLGSAIGELTKSLGLSDEQVSAIQELAAQHEDQERAPGAAWYAAVGLQRILSSEQISTIDTQLAAAPSRIRSRPGARSFRGMSGHRDGYAQLNLTEEQQAQVRAVLESHRAEFQGLREEFRGTDVSRDEMRSRAEAVREAIRAEIEPLLTQEQRDRLLEREAGLEERREAAMKNRQAARQRGEAEHAAMVDALGLTDAQIEQMESLRQDRGAHRDGFGEILTDDQREVVTLHRALVAHRFRASGPEGRGRGAGRNGGAGGRFEGARVHGGTKT